MRSTVLGLEQAHLLVELRGDLLQSGDGLVVLRLTVQRGHVILLLLELEALQVHRHIAVVLLERLHRSDHFLLVRRVPIGNLAGRGRQYAVRVSGQRARYGRRDQRGANYPAGYAHGRLSSLRLKAQLSTLATVASRRSGLNGLTSQPVAPAALPSNLRSVVASVVSTSSGMPL